MDVAHNMKTSPTGGTTEEALALLQQEDPERAGQIGVYQVIAWLAAELRSARNDQDISQTELARRLGTTQPTISRMESGEIDPSFSRACQAMGVMGYRFVPVPISDENTIVATESQIQALIEQEIASRFEMLKKSAMSEVLVHLAQRGGSGALRVMDAHGDPLASATPHATA